MLVTQTQVLRSFTQVKYNSVEILCYKQVKVDIKIYLPCQNAQSTS